MFNTEAFKKSVLNQAMQGKLTQQLPGDGDAADLLQSIAEEKQCLYKTGKIKKPKQLSAITDDKIPFEIPDNWQWVKLGNLTLYDIGGNTPSKANQNNWNKNGIPWLSVKDINNEYINDSIDHISIEASKSTARMIPSNSFIAVTRMAVGKFTINTKPMAINQDLRALIMDNNIINYIQLIYPILQFKTKGATVKGITKKELLNTIIPLPPLSEQNRIVKNIDECFKLTDLIDQEQQLTKNFDNDMYKSLLQSAMQGKLTQQLPGDGDAADLLRSITEEKQHLYKAGKIKKPKKLAAITDDEIPFKIPDNWQWVRLNDVGVWKSGSTPRRNHPEYYGGNIPWLKTGDLNDNYINNTTEKITKSGVNHSSLNINPVGSVLIAMYGATISKLGILNIQATTNQACCACDSYNGIYNRFLFYYLMSQRSNLISLGAGGAQSNISRTKIVHYAFPLPPLSEQKRIVNKLDSLFSSINKI